MDGHPITGSAQHLYLNLYDKLHEANPKDERFFYTGFIWFQSL